MTRSHRAQATRGAINLIVTNKLWTVQDCCGLVGCCPRTILDAIRTGALQAIDRTYYRHAPDGRRLRRRYYAIPDWALHEWILQRAQARKRPADRVAVNVIAPRPP